MPDESTKVNGLSDEARIEPENEANNEARKQRIHTSSSSSSWASIPSGKLGRPDHVVRACSFTNRAARRGAVRRHGGTMDGVGTIHKRSCSLKFFFFVLLQKLSFRSIARLHDHFTIAVDFRGRKASQQRSRSLITKIEADSGDQRRNNQQKIQSMDSRYSRWSVRIWVCKISVQFSRLCVRARF